MPAKYPPRPPPKSRILSVAGGGSRSMKRPPRRYRQLVLDRTARRRKKLPSLAKFRGLGVGVTQRAEPNIATSGVVPAGRGRLPEPATAPTMPSPPLPPQADDRRRSARAKYRTSVISIQ